MNNNTRNNILIALAVVAVMALIYGLSPYKPAVSVDWSPQASPTESTVKRSVSVRVAEPSQSSDKNSIPWLSQQSTDSPEYITNRSIISGRCLIKMGLTIGTEEEASRNQVHFGLAVRGSGKSLRQEIVFSPNLIDHGSGFDMGKIKSCLSE